MPQSPTQNVVAHWDKLFENFHTPTTAFYANVETALKEHEVPGLSTTRVHWREGGIQSASREYLRIIGDRHCIDICAAPFGKAYFFSSWTSLRPARFVFLTAIAFVIAEIIACGVLLKVLQFILSGTGEYILFSSWALIAMIPGVATLFLLYLVAVAARAGKLDLELSILAIPILGWLYEKFFAPQSFYRLDTVKMFHSAVHSVMLEAIDAITSQKGLRALSEAERKPLFHKFL